MAMGFAIIYSAGRALFGSNVFAFDSWQMRSNQIAITFPASQQAPFCMSCDCSQRGHNKLGKLANWKQIDCIIGRSAGE